MTFDQNKAYLGDTASVENTDPACIQQGVMLSPANYVTIAIP